MKLCVRAFVPLEEISCLLKKFLVTGRKFSCHRNNFLSQEAISCHINIFLVTRKFSCNGKKLFTRNILALDKVNIFSCKQYVLPVRGFVPPFAISIHLLCTNSIFPVTRTLFLVRDNSFLMKFGSS